LLAASREGRTEALENDSRLDGFRNHLFGG